MIGFSRASFLPVPRKPMGPTAGIIAELGGDSVGNNRTVNTITITNNKAFPIGFSIEQESNKVPVSVTIQPGQTTMLRISPLATYWNTAGPFPRWDGLNIRWKEPA